MKKIHLINPFTDEAYLVTHVTEVQLESFIKKTYPNYQGWVGGVASGRTEDPDDKNGVKHFYVWVDEKLSKKDRRLIIIHEVIHLVMDIFKDAGVPISQENDETFTYVHGSFTEQIFKHLRV